MLGVGLVSGGLDSLIATFLLQQQNIEIIGLNFQSPFCICKKAYQNAECGLNLFYEKLNIKVHHLQKQDDYIDIIRNPKYGYGKNLNPCIDCRIYILRKAKKFAGKINADFIYTGEVLNQRPKSQNLKALKIVEKESNLQGQLLRPLSAKLLEPTILEEKGLIDRSKLLGIKGRSRKPQLKIAQKYNLLEEYYACGGCLLTDKSFSNRLRDLLAYNRDIKMEDIIFLKYGRHFRYKNTKIIIGRDELENKILSRIKKKEDYIMEAKDVVGPITLIRGTFNRDILNFAGKITLSYSDLKNKMGKIIYGKKLIKKSKEITLKKGKKKEFKEFII